MSAHEVQSEVEAIFEFANSNGDDKLDIAELKALFNRLRSKPISEQEAEELFKQLDTNGDNVIEQREFVSEVARWVMRGRHKRGAGEGGGGTVDSRKRLKHEILSAFGGGGGAPTSFEELRANLRAEQEQVYDFEATIDPLYWKHVVTLTPEQKVAHLRQLGVEDPKLAPTLVAAPPLRPAVGVVSH